MKLRATRDTFNVINNKGRTICWGTVDASGNACGIDMPDDIRKCNFTRLSVVKLLTTERLAEAYYRGELRAANELGRTAFVEDMAHWARVVLLRKYFPAKCG